MTQERRRQSRICFKVHAVARRSNCCCAIAHASDCHIFDLPIAHRWQPAEHVAETSEWVEAVPPVAFDDGVDDGAAVALLGVAYEEPVFRKCDATCHRMLVRLTRGGVAEPVPNRAERDGRKGSSFSHEWQHRRVLATRREALARSLRNPRDVPGLTLTAVRKASTASSRDLRHPCGSCGCL